MEIIKFIFEINIIFENTIVEKEIYIGNIRIRLV